VGFKLENLLRRRITIIIIMIILYLFFYPIFLSHYDLYSALKELSYNNKFVLYLYSLIFVMLLPLGFVNLFIDIHKYSHTMQYLIWIVVGVVFGGAFAFYMVRYKTIESKVLIFYSLVILIIFILSMKGCVSIFANMWFFR
jgi:hypothetical protein